MNAVIIHESRGRMRLQCRLKQKEMSLRQADLLEKMPEARGNPPML